jgi:metallo-beta-lactamase family protein
MIVRFLGATNTVTGSKYLVAANSRSVLVDAGLFQGFKQLRLRNWSVPPFDPASLEAAVLTHAHIDHSGYIPVLMRNGFRGHVYATPATFELCKILLPDSGYLQEEQARFENRHGYSKHKPALPLYTQDEATRSLELFRTVRLDHAFEAAPGLEARFSRAGHVLGAASVRISSAASSILFSGDVGRPNDVLMRAPDPPQSAEYLVVESTYGDELHPTEDVYTQLSDAINRATERGGVVIAPTFAVGRAQLMMLLLSRLKARKLIADVPVYLDSPMAIDATDLYKRFAGEHRLSAEESFAMCHAARLVHTPDQSKLLDQLATPCIILSASGMATGGRVVHHLKTFAPDARNLILLPGFQAGGTRGASLAAGAPTVRIHGQEIPVRAEVVQLASMSAHADANELLGWMRQMPSPPKLTFVTHGEPNASDTLRKRIEHELGWEAQVPDYRDTVTLT